MSGFCNSVLSISNRVLVYNVWILGVIILLNGGTLSQVTHNSRNKDVSNNDQSHDSILSESNSRINRNIIPKDYDESQQKMQSSKGNATKTDVHPLQITIQTKRRAIFMDLYVQKTIKMNYTLRCDHPSTAYRLLGKSDKEDVASVIRGNSIKISCKFGTIMEESNKNPYHNNTTISTGNQNENSNSMMGITNIPIKNLERFQFVENNSLHLGFDISGEFEMRFESHRIGRSFFKIFATKISGPDSQALPSYEIKRVNNTNNSATNGKNNADSHIIGIMSKNQDETHSKISDSMNNRRDDSEKHKGIATDQQPSDTVVKTMIIVMKLPGPIDKIFRIVLYVVIITATIGMGIKVELDIVIKVLKKPLGPFIGLFCQYLCMPLIAYLIAKAVPQPSAAISLGIFTCGIVPGGGASNFWCYLLGGDVTLSVTMTTISSVAALGLIPMWLFTLGNNFHDDTTALHVPYPKILETLAIVLLPVFVGIILKRKLPKFAKIISKILKPFLIVIVLFLLAVGIYANFFIFAMIGPMQILAGCLLPYVGFAMGGGIALLTCRSWEHVKTIAIETGIQNTGIAFMIVFFSFPPPDNQLAVVAPAASAIMTPLPLIVITFFYIIYRRRQQRKEKAQRASVSESEEGQKSARLRESSQYDTKVQTKPSFWEKITGKTYKDKPVATDMEEMLNQEIRMEDKF